METMLGNFDVLRRKTSGKRKAKQFSLISLSFAPRANGSFLFYYFFVSLFPLYAWQLHYTPGYYSSAAGRFHLHRKNLPAAGATEYLNPGHPHGNSAR
jgi:hypothetical protein